MRIKHPYPFKGFRKRTIELSLLGVHNFGQGIQARVFGYSCSGVFFNRRDLATLAKSRLFRTNPSRKRGFEKCLLITVSQVKWLKGLRDWMSLSNYFSMLLLDEIKIGDFGWNYWRSLRRTEMRNAKYSSWSLRSWTRFIENRQPFLAKMKVLNNC